MKEKIASIMLCTLLLTVAFSLGTNGSTTNQDALVLAKISDTHYDFLSANDYEIVGSQPGSVFVITPASSLGELEARGIGYEIVIQDVQAYEDGVRGQYHSLAQIDTILQTISTDYPSITSLYSIGTTYEGRSIWCLEISDNPGVDEGEPGVLFMGVHHAREWPGAEICLYIADQLTSNYGSDPDVTDAVDNNRIWVITVVNPDGYYYCHDQGHDWRKNRAPYPGGIGVDNNRNYGGSSDGNPWGSWGSVFQSAATHDPSQEVFCGGGPFSELEDQAIRNMFVNNNISAGISYHTYGELVLWPWGYTTAGTDDSAYLTTIGQGIASKITQQDGSGTYTPQQSDQLYPTTGDFLDWSYGNSYYVQGRPTFVYTIEACQEFEPAASHLDQICQENFDGAFYLLQQAGTIRDTVPSRVMPPVIDSLPVDIDGTYTVSWQEKNPNANPEKFQLDELTGLVQHTDDAEAGSSLWALDGFSVSTTRSHSTSHSYKSRYQDSDVSTMITVTPLPVSQGMKLSFWCWYNEENNYDYAFVEVSRDGRYYDTLDGFTGSSGAWVYKEYSLDNYTNDSVFIRIRAVTDDNTLQEGFYIDDISPVPTFNTIHTISNTITEHHYDVTGKTQGDYYYRVMGYNTAKGWGDFSTLRKVVVSNITNEPPNPPTITGPATGKAGTRYTFTFVSTDPDGNDVSYFIDWGDGINSSWIGPFGSAQAINANHTWSEQGTFVIKAKARDIYGEESSWSTLSVKMPYSLPFMSFWEQLFERFPNAFPILRNLLGH
jgi:carboxypeptidase T